MLTATALGLGRWPWGPGTLTSAVVAGAVYALGPSSVGVLIAAGLVVAAVGVPVAGAAERELGPDASAITIDEAAGMLLALAAAPPTLAGYCLAFLLFRALDILKPRPLRRLQGLRGGFGVVADDVAAGLGSAALLLLLRVAGGSLRWLSGTR